MDADHLTGHQVLPPGSCPRQGGCGPVSQAATGRHPTDDEMFAAAQWWVRTFGFRLFPTEINGKRPAVPRGFKAATADLRAIRGWFAGDGFAYNLATPTGAPGSDVLDVDQRGEAGSGFPALNRLKRAALLSGAYLLVGTPNGGLHLHFAGTAQRSGRLTAEHLDFKAAGGYVLLPPSRVDGRPSADRRGLRLGGREAATAATWACEGVGRSPGQRGPSAGLGR
jgi:Bifunctional DNA primase/polymerase, N-terminal